MSVEQSRKQLEAAKSLLEKAPMHSATLGLADATMNDADEPTRTLGAQFETFEQGFLAHVTSCFGTQHKVTEAFSAVVEIVGETPENSTAGEALGFIAMTAVESENMGTEMNAMHKPLTDIIAHLGEVRQAIAEYESLALLTDVHRQTAVSARQTALDSLTTYLDQLK